MVAIRKLKLALGALLLVWALSVFASGPKNSTAQNEPALEFLERQRKHLRSKDPKLRQQAISFILEERRENISMLLGGMLQDETLYPRNPKTVVDAMRLLGKMRAKEAVGILAEHIDFQSPQPPFPFPSGGGVVY